jgi:peptide-methionine (S)-S-oxide reductase
MPVVVSMMEDTMKLMKENGRHLPRISKAAVGLILLMTISGSQKIAAFPDPPIDSSPQPSSRAEIAVLAGGCFWGMEGVFERLRGVIDVTSGYSGGDKGTAEYEMVSTGLTGHAESIRITYDPLVVTYGTLLKIFFAVAHNPTELNFQGPDYGSQYRSVIFYVDTEQEKIARSYIDALDRAKVFPKKIVTQLEPLKAFYPAEEYHQNFMEKNPDYPYIVYWDKPKVEKLEREYPKLVTGK